MGILCLLGSYSRVEHGGYSVKNQTPNHRGPSSSHPAATLHWQHITHPGAVEGMWHEKSRCEPKTEYRLGFVDPSLGTRIHRVSQWPAQCGCTLSTGTPTNPRNFLPKLDVQLSKTSVELGLEELEQCPFEPETWRNDFRRGLRIPSATPASGIPGWELIFVNKEVKPKLLLDKNLEIHQVINKWSSTWKF